MRTEFEYKAAWWLPGPHCQTIWSRFFRKEIELNTLRERVELPDGDFVDLDWNVSGDGPIVLILHGLGGSIESHYAKGLLTAIEKKGWRGVLMHFRGCSGVNNRYARSYHAGETKDLGEILQLLKQRFPDTPFVAVGYSLGGNVLLKWLGEQHGNNLSAAVAVSVPFDLTLSSKRLNEGFSKVYQWYLLRRLKQSIQRKAEILHSEIDVSKALKSKTIKEFDNLVTAPLHGFSGVDEYYQQSSSRQYLKNINTPTLIIHAKDDPFVSEQAIPKSHELSASTQFNLTDRGGHVGFVSGKFTEPTYWIEQRIIKYFERYL